MSKVAKFYKVSEERFIKDWLDNFSDSENEAKNIYNDIKLPKRATVGSAGYDFYTPISFSLKPNEQIKIPTGIRVKMKKIGCFVFFLEVVGDLNIDCR